MIRFIFFVCGIVSFYFLLKKEDKKQYNKISEDLENTDFEGYSK